MISDLDIIWAKAENEKEEKIKVLDLGIWPFQTASSN